MSEPAAPEERNYIPLKSLSKDRIEALRRASTAIGDTQPGRDLLSGRVDPVIEENTLRLEEKVVNLEREKDKEEKLAKLHAELNVRDALTGLYNRRELDRVLNGLDPDVDVTIMMLDLDHFKGFNDTFGHMQGDELLMSTARLLQNNFKVTRRNGGESDKVFRYGGEEFLLLLYGIKEKQAQQRAETVREKIAANRVGSKQNLGTTASIGIARRNKNEDIKETLGRADQALYLAKKFGRDRVELAKP